MPDVDLDWMGERARLQRALREAENDAIALNIELDRAEAERDRLAAQVARVRALAESNRDLMAGGKGRTDVDTVWPGEILQALDGDS